MTFPRRSHGPAWKTPDTGDVMRRWWAGIAMALGLGLTSPALAQDHCRLALVLALDVSSSVDEREYLLQRNGLASALIAPEVVEAFLASPQPVALTAYEWSGRFNQHLVLDWTEIDSAADLLDASARVSAAARSQDEFPTAMGYALAHAAKMFRSAPECLARTIDVRSKALASR